MRKNVVRASEKRRLEKDSRKGWGKPSVKFPYKGDNSGAIHLPGNNPTILPPDVTWRCVLRIEPTGGATTSSSSSSSSSSSTIQSLERRPLSDDQS